MASAWRSACDDASLHERSLLAALLVLRDLESALTELPKAVGRALRSVGVPEDAIRAEQAAMSEVRIGRTRNRRLIGCLNECAFGLSTQLDCMHEDYLGEHEKFMASFTYSTTEYRWPHALARELFEAADPGPRRRLARPH